MLIFKLASRNLVRQASRNVLSMVSIVMGVFVIVLGSGLAGGLDENAIRGQIDSSSGHAVIVPADYPKTGFRAPVADAFSLDDKERAFLDANTTAWTPRLIAAPRAIAGRESMRVRMYGIADTDDSVFPRDEWKVEGAYPKAGEVLVAASPARLLGLEPGGILTLETRTVDGAINASRYVVSGVVRSGNPMIDNVSIFLPYADADQLLDARGRMTHVATRMSRRDASEAFATQARKAIDGVEVRTWQTEVAPIMEAGESRRAMFAVIGLALMGMAATGIANTVLMAAFERVREIGTLRSMGLQRVGVLGMFALEGLWMGVIGGLVGSGLGGAITYYYSVNGIDMAALIAGKADSMSNMPVSAVLYMEFSPAILLVGWLTAVVVSVLASIYPAMSASNISPSEAVRAS